MNTLRTISVGLIAACLGAFACSSSGSGPGAGDGGASSGSSSGGGSGCTWNACGLLTQQTASQALQSTSLSACTEMDSPGTGGAPGTFGAEFTTPDSSILVSMSMSCNPGNIANSASWYTTITQAVGTHATPVTLAKVDAAFWVTSPDSGTSSGGGILLVFFGGHSGFNITLVLPPTTTVNAQAAATQMATAVIAGLNL